MSKIDKIPDGFTLHTDDSRPNGYPTGVTHSTWVDVVVHHKDKNVLILWESICAQSAGWRVNPLDGWTDIPIVAYRILDPEQPQKKGMYNGYCNREACQKPGAVWYNVSTRKYYCPKCAEEINLYSIPYDGYPVCELRTAEEAVGDPQ